MMGYGDGRVDLGAPRIDPAELGIAQGQARANKKKALEWKTFVEKAQGQAREAIRQRNHFRAEAAEREAERDAWVSTLNEFRKRFAPDVPKEDIIASFDRFLAERKSSQGSFPR